MKKILIIATAILVFILVIIAALTNMMKRGANTGQNLSPTPTTAPFNAPPASPQTNQLEPTLAPQPINEGLKDAGRSITPYETETFKFEYSEVNNSFVVTEKVEGGRDDYSVWIDKEMGLPELAEEGEFVTVIPYSATGQYPNNEKGYKGFIDFMNLFFKYSESESQPREQTPTSTPQNPSNNETNSNSSSKNNVSSNNSGQSGFKYTYYAQCNGYGNISLPGGCDLCDAGCGPTTVSMIAASYLGKEHNPKTIVDLYEDKGYYLSCAGSRYSDAKAALESLGLKTTSYLTYNFETSDKVASDFKKYLDAGWTIFTLANYCDKGCGHYFWVTEVKNGNILAYDPYYGKSSTPPYNENARYPFPKYRIAFGVKK